MLMSITQLVPTSHAQHSRQHSTLHAFAAECSFLPCDLQLAELGFPNTPVREVLFDLYECFDVFVFPSSSDTCMAARRRGAALHVHLRSQSSELIDECYVG